MFYQIFCVVLLLTSIIVRAQDDILEYENVVNPDGSYKWKYITNNGITAEEEGALKNADSDESGSEEVHGSYQYTAPDGTLITVSYVANEYGFQPKIKIGSADSSFDVKSARLLKVASEDKPPETTEKTEDSEKSLDNATENL